MNKKRKEKKQKEYEKRRQDFEIQQKIRRKKLESSANHFLKTGILPQHLDSLYPMNWSKERKKEDLKEYERKEKRNAKIREKRKQKKRQNNEKKFQAKINRELSFEKLQSEIGNPSWRWKQRREYAERKQKEASKKGEFLKFLFYLDVKDQCIMMERRYNRVDAIGCLSDEVKDKMEFNAVPEFIGNSPLVKDAPDEMKNDLDFLPLVFGITCKREEQV